MAQSCLILCDPMDCSLPGSPVVGISQTRILEVGSHSLLLGIFLTQGSNPRPASPVLGGGFFTTKPPGKPHTNGREGNLNKVFKQVEKYETFFKASTLLSFILTLIQNKDKKKSKKREHKSY